MPHFLKTNNWRKGSNQISSWRIHHGIVIYSKIESKIFCNKEFSIIHSIVNGLSLVIIYLVVIVLEITHKDGDTK
jgi:hypothetical protein